MVAIDKPMSPINATIPVTAATLAISPKSLGSRIRARIPKPNKLMNVIETCIRIVENPPPMVFFARLDLSKSTSSWSGGAVVFEELFPAGG